ncbi:MAG: chemotaxis protein CheR [Acidobacteriia bacterium]|nr:chemotaxis protein CheR [Terriglobia bacterium]
MAFTFFFRDLHVLELIVRHAIPILASRSYARVWDAGCAMGQEPYSLCILLAESMGRFAFNNLRILASDLDDCNLFGPIIAAGVYPWEEVERMPPGILEKYFEPDEKPGHFRVKDTIRGRITFQKHDLLSLQEIGQGLSLIVCKNVLLHLQAAERVEVIRMFHRALTPGGYFAVEQTQDMPVEFRSLFERVVPDGRLYRKVEGSGCGS